MSAGFIRVAPLFARTRGIKHTLRLGTKLGTIGNDRPPRAPKCFIAPLRWWRITTHYSLLTTHSLLLSAHFLLPTTHYPPLTTGYFLPTTYYLLLTTYYLLLTTYYLLLTAGPSRVRCSDAGSNLGGTATSGRCGFRSFTIAHGWCRERCGWVYEKSASRWIYRGLARGSARGSAPSGSVRPFFQPSRRNARAQTGGS